MANYILVIDCNNFFVSCERLFRPDLEGKPVIVLSSNDGCVVARSQEIKDMGIPMGVPLFQIKDSIKDKGVTLFSGNHALYRNLSQRVMAVIRAEGYRCEQYSIDEAFVVYTAPNDEAVMGYARQLRAKIRQWVGVPVSIGVGLSKTHAKLANDYAKRSTDGVFLIDAAWCRTTGAGLSVGVIWGIGARLAERYRRAGLATLNDVMDAPPLMLRTIGGRIALQQQAELTNHVAYPVGQGQGPQKSMVSSQTLGQPTADEATLLDAVTHHVTKITRELQRKKLATATFQVYLRPKDRNFYGQRWWLVALETPTNGTATVLQAVVAEVKRTLVASRQYGKVGVLAANLSADITVQTSLFGAPLPTRHDELDSVLRYLHQHAKHHPIRLGQFIKQPKWRAKQASLSPGYVTDWAALPAVRTF